MTLQIVVQGTVATLRWRDTLRLVGFASYLSDDSKYTNRND